MRKWPSSGSRAVVNLLSQKKLSIHFEYHTNEPTFFYIKLYIVCENILRVVHSDDKWVNFAVDDREKAGSQGKLPEILQGIHCVSISLYACQF